MTVRGRRVFTIVLFGLIAVAVVLFYLYQALPPSTAIERRACPEHGSCLEITLLEPIMSSLLFYGALIFAGLLVWIGVAALFNHSLLAGTLSILVGVIGLPVSFLNGADADAGWRHERQTITGEESEYVLVTRRSRDSLTLCIGTPWSRSALRRSTKVLACGIKSYQHENMPYLQLVQNSNGGGSNQLQFLRCEGVLLAVSHGAAYVAYDVARGKAFKGKELLALSPFLCLGPEDAISGIDMEQIEAYIRAECAKLEASEWMPILLATITRGLSHPNHAVRELSKRLRVCLLDRLNSQPRDRQP